MHFSAFTKFFNENRKHIAASLANEIRREAIARVTERMSGGRADCELTFTDLIGRIEAAISGSK